MIMSDNRKYGRVTIPTDTVIEESENAMSLKLSVAASDMGKVIGKHGKIAKAIRQLMKAAANGTGKKVTIDIE